MFSAHSTILTAMNVTCLNATNCSHELPISDHGPFMVFTTVLLALTVFLIILLNSLSLLVLHRARGIQETTKIFMVSLAVSDLCVGLFSALPDLLQAISRKWVLGEFLCTALGIVSPACYMISTFSLLLLTVDRYVAIIHSLQYPRLLSPRRTKVIVALLWSVSLILCVLLFGLLAKSAMNTANQQCWRSLGIVFKCFTVCGLPIPLVIIIVLYIHILKVARRQARRIAAENFRGNPPDGQDAPQPISTKGATTVIIITVTIFICWTPIVLLQFVNSMSEVINGLLHLFNVAYLSNSWLNCVIYYWRNKELRQALHSLVSSYCH